MSNINRRNFLGLTAVGLGGLALGGGWTMEGKEHTSSAGLEALYEKFKDPDRRYSIRPFWFWNGKLEGAELRRQIKEMVDHGVYGAYVHNRDGLQTPYLSEAWWEAVGEALAAARDYGFSLCMVDEFEWPSGEARDYWLPGINKSRVVAANPDFHIHRLKPVETRFEGSRRIRIPLPQRPVAVVVARQTAYQVLDGESLRTLSWKADAKEIDWEVPNGEWIVFTYGIERAMGQPDHGHVDLMSREAIAKYIEIYYEEFYRRYGKYFGNTLPATFADHEGDYGSKLPWTPRLLDTFRRNAGYALEPYLPALTYDIGPKTEKVRCDLLDSVSELYSNSFFKQVTDWCHQHGIQHSGHVWEESLFFGPMEQGDFFRILRSLSNPGCDTLVEWGRQSVWLKEDASVADFEGRHVVCENQGVQGENSYLSPERMRRVSNCLGAWNIGEFIPHAFDYDLSRINFPPDWFRSQPYLPWFHAYADQMRRISFMNRESHNVAEILLLYPQVSIWGQSAPAFRSENFGTLVENASWSDDAAETNDLYAQMKLRLTEERLDYKIADDYYLAQSRFEDRQLRIADSRFQVLVLPPMSTIRRSSAERLRDFYRAGGAIITLGRLPMISVESGRDDEALKNIWEELFDLRSTPAAFRLKQNAAGGRTYFVQRSVADLLQALRQILTEPDVEVPEGPTDHLYVLHKIKDGIHFYWIVNDTDSPRTNLLALRAIGRPERWDAHTSQRSPLFYQNKGEQTLVRLSLGPWDAAYIVFSPSERPQPLALLSTNLDDLYIDLATSGEVTVRGNSLLKGETLFAELGGGGNSFRGEYQAPKLEPLEITGSWKVTVESSSISAPYALAVDDPEDRGLRERWYHEAKGRLGWSPLWLSSMNCAIRDWNVIGPFPNPKDMGLERTYPPEQGIEYDAVYLGEDRHQLRWQQVNAAAFHAGREGRGHVGAVKMSGGPYGTASFVLNYGVPLRLSPLEGVIYAQTNVYCPEEMNALMLLATPNPRAAFLNGEQVYSRWLRPLYNRLVDGFAARIPVHLRTGWNSLLLKFLHNPENPAAPHFTCRIGNSDGEMIERLVAAPRAFDMPRSTAPSAYRWLRFPVPPLASALNVAALRHPWLAFVDETRAVSNQQILLPRGTRFVTLRVQGGEIMDRPFAFSTIPAMLPLGTWKTPGLELFSGRMIYEKTVDVPPALLAERLLLDCGAVGVVAEAWVNGHSVGSRAWSPYVFDATDEIRPGSNHLKVRVANTAANARAVGESHGILENIDLDGWLGPARLVPYIDREFQCKKV